VYQVAKARGDITAALAQGRTALDLFRQARHRSGVKAQFETLIDLCIAVEENEEALSYANQLYHMCSRGDRPRVTALMTRLKEKLKHKPRALWMVSVDGGPSSGAGGEGTCTT
jgi:hypothetical protein